jgi:Cu-Zn family superoxide dismutase
MQFNRRLFFIGISALLFCGHIFAATHTSTKIRMYMTSKSLFYIGYIEAFDTKYGLLLKPKLQDLPPGLHGFHIHEFPNCTNSGQAAGGHYDPKHTSKHLGPYDINGHMGDLPALNVDNKGEATLPILAPHLTVAQIKGRALIIHEGPDNYSDMPQKLGGGGNRIACGIIK